MQNRNSKKVWHQTVVALKDVFASVGVGSLCKLFGKTRHAFYDKNWYLSKRYSDERVVLELLHQIRREVPVLSTRTIYYMIKPTMDKHGITMGRDAIHELRRRNCLLYRRRKRYFRTTDSMHRFYKYPNRIKDLQITHSEQVWVCDITYIRQQDGFSFLSLITDAYSRKIVGYHLHRTLSAQGTLEALRMAIASLSRLPTGIIHHSDRGIQYCCDDYIKQLQVHGIESSMTDNGDPYENAIAERVNGLLKKNFGLGRTFAEFNDSMVAVGKAINAYNNIRPHQSVSMLTPSEAHEHEGELRRTWKNKRNRLIQQQNQG